MPQNLFNYALQNLTTINLTPLSYWAEYITKRFEAAGKQITQTTENDLNYGIEELFSRGDMGGKQGGKEYTI